MGASLLAISVGQLALMLDARPSSRAGSLPQGFRAFTDQASTIDPLWELSLLAMAVGQLALMLDARPSSRASSAPTGDLHRL
ncbi:hypothetical protein DZG01_22060 [Pseudomonas fluorescens]|nr:hypothetical protein DZG01_22060 [Pseudomonas fluorescens]